MPARKKAARPVRKAKTAKKAATIGKSLKTVGKRVARKAAEKLHRAAETAAQRAEKSKKAKSTAALQPPPPRAVRPSVAAKRVTRLSSPIPDPDVMTPSQGSSHGPFDERSRRDPDRIRPAEKILNEQFEEADHFTNRTGNPRIGTRGRKRYD